MEALHESRGKLRLSADGVKWCSSRYSMLTHQSLNATLARTVVSIRPCTGRCSDGTSCPPPSGTSLAESSWWPWFSTICFSTTMKPLATRYTQTEKPATSSERFARMTKPVGRMMSVATASVAVTNQRPLLRPNPNVWLRRPYMELVFLVDLQRCMFSREGWNFLLSGHKEGRP